MITSSWSPIMPAPLGAPADEFAGQLADADHLAHGILTPREQVLHHRGPCQADLGLALDLGLGEGPAILKVPALDLREGHLSPWTVVR